MNPENWDTYFCHVDGRPASILVDLGRIADAPVARLPLLGYVRVALNAPDEQGFPAREEYDRLAELEDVLEASLRNLLAACYAGRCATDGRFDFFFYLPEDAEWGAILRRAFASFNEFDWEAGSSPDPEWETYGQFLFPDAYAMLGIQNRRLRRQLQDLGDDTAVCRRVEHWAAFPDAVDAGAFAAAAAQQGFALERVQEDDPENAPASEAITEDIPASWTAASDPAEESVGESGEALEGEPDGNPGGERDGSPVRGPDGLPAGERSEESAEKIFGEESVDFTALAAGPQLSSSGAVVGLGLLRHTPDVPGPACAAAAPAAAAAALSAVGRAVSGRTPSLIHVCLSRPDAPEQMDDVTFALADLALEHEGVYLGWAAPILAQSSGSGHGVPEG